MLGKVQRPIYPGGAGGLAAAAPVSLERIKHLGPNVERGRPLAQVSIACGDLANQFSSAVGASDLPISEMTDEAHKRCTASGSVFQTVPLAQGVTLIVSAVVWLVAEVAVTVMELAPGGVPPPPPPGGVLLPPPQLPRSTTKPAAVQTRAAFRAALCRRINASRATLKQPVSAKIKNRGPGCWKSSGATAEGAVVVRVRVVEIGLMPGIRTGGEKLQLEAAGNPLQAKPTAEEKSPMGLMVMLNVAD